LTLKRLDFIGAPADDVKLGIIAMMVVNVFTTDLGVKLPIGISLVENLFYFITRVPERIGMSNVRKSAQPKKKGEGEKKKGE
jgi:hypothetical protein